MTASPILRTQAEAIAQNLAAFQSGQIDYATFFARQCAAHDALEQAGETEAFFCRAHVAMMD